MPDADAMQMGLQVGRGHGGNGNLIASLFSRAGPDRTPTRPRHGAVGSGSRRKVSELTPAQMRASIASQATCDACIAR
jgi:hypothetical protein